MLPQQKFLKLINDILTSKYFTLTISLIGFSIGTGIFVNKLFGLIAFIFISTISFIFIIVIFFITKRANNGYVIENVKHNWQMNDPEGKEGNGTKKYTIKLRRSLKSIREYLSHSEALVGVNGNSVIVHNEIIDGDQKIVVVNFDALYPNKAELSFEIVTKREILSQNHDSKYLEIPIRVETKSTSANISLPSRNNNANNGPNAIIYQRKFGTIEKLPEIQKNLTGNILHRISVDEENPWNIKWECSRLDIESDYIIKWKW